MIFLPPPPTRIQVATRIFLTFLFLGFAALQPAKAKPQSADASATMVPVRVGDFELYSVPPPPNSPKTPAAAQNQQKPKTTPTQGDPEIPSVQARRFTDFFAVTLVEALQKSGYTARRASCC